jgi:hypothetical protein
MSKPENTRKDRLEGPIIHPDDYDRKTGANPSKTGGGSGLKRMRISRDAGDAQDEDWGREGRGR